MGTHIPETGPLTPQSVDASFEQARGFFVRPLFAGVPIESLLLLPPGCWTPHSPTCCRPTATWSGSSAAGPFMATAGIGDDADVVFFVFRRRGLATFLLAGLPRDTALQRAVLDRIERRRPLARALGDAPPRWRDRSGLRSPTVRRSVPHFRHDPGRAPTEPC